MAESWLFLHNGVAMDSHSVPILDTMVIRGDGCFEAIRCYDGGTIGLEAHLIRLERSASVLEIALPLRDEIRAWVLAVAADRQNGVVRILASAEDDGESNVYVLSMPVPAQPTEQRLLPVSAPWHPAGAPWELAGVKTLSYAPNMGATRVARQAGFDDALLVSTDGTILEAPTAGVFWVVDGVIETAPLELGILDSVTVNVALEIAHEQGISVVRSRFPLGRLAEAAESAIMSTSREILPVVAVGDLEMAPGPVTEMLAREYLLRVER